MARYGRHRETLTALVSYLALTQHTDRTPHRMADELGLSREEVRRVLDGFPGIFRKSMKAAKDRGGLHWYTLQVRYATKPLDKNQEDGPPLASRYLTTLLELVDERCRQEAQARATWVAVASAVFAAGAAFSAAVIAATIKAGWLDAWLW